MEVFYRCLYHCVGIQRGSVNTRDHAWFGPPDACRNAKRDCANNQICNFYLEGYYNNNPNHGIYDERYYWGRAHDIIGESGCVDCPGTTAESCQDAFDINERTFEDCIEICAGGKNPNNIQFISNAA